MGASAVINEVKSGKIDIKGVNVRVAIEGEELEIFEDGTIYIGMMGIGPITINVYVDPGVSVFGFTVSGKKEGEKEIVSSRNYSKGPQKHYKKKVIIGEGADSLYTLGDNRIRLIYIESNGYFGIYEAAIVIQNDEIFFTTQRVYEGFCYYDIAFDWRGGIERKVVCSEFSKWPQLLEYLYKLHKENNTFDLLPDFGLNYVSDPLTKNASMGDLPERLGVVEYFNVASGYGGILTNNGTRNVMAYVHYSDIKITNGSRLAYLMPGQQVYIEELVPSNDSKYSFDFKAKGVEVLKVKG